MKKYAPLIVIAVVFIAGIAGLVAYGINQNSQDSQAPGASAGDDMSKMKDQSKSSDSADISEAVSTDKVEIKNFSYGPSNITVKAGTTVTWTNMDSIKHNVVGDDLKDLDGPLLAEGETYSYTFDKAGSYGYYCSPHPYMKGTVTVTE